MLTTHDLLVGVVLPLILAGLVLLIAWRPWNKSAAPARWGGPTATGLAFISAFGLLEGRAHLFPPVSATPWLFYIGIGFTLLALLESLVRMPAILRGIIVFIATATAAGLLLKFNFVNGTWDAIHGGMYLAAIGTAGLIWWISFESTAADHGIAAPMTMAATTGLSALAVALAADQTLGQGLGAMALVMTVALVLALFSRQVSMERGTATVISGVGVLLLAAACFVSPLELRTGIVFGVAPIMLLVGRVPIVRKLRPWMRMTIQIVLLLGVLGAGLGLGVAQFNREKADAAGEMGE